MSDSDMFVENFYMFAENPCQNMLDFYMDLEITCQKHVRFDKNQREIVNLDECLPKFSPAVHILYEKEFILITRQQPARREARIADV